MCWARRTGRWSWQIVMGFGWNFDVPKLFEKLGADKNPQNRTTGDIQALMSAAKAEWGSNFHQDGGF